jgi:hypothetical protein
MKEGYVRACVAPRLTDDVSFEEVWRQDVRHVDMDRYGQVGAQIAREEKTPTQPEMVSGRSARAADTVTTELMFTMQESLSTQMDQLASKAEVAALKEEMGRMHALLKGNKPPTTSPRGLSIMPTWVQQTQGSTPTGGVRPKTVIPYEEYKQRQPQTSKAIRAKPGKQPEVKLFPTATATVTSKSEYDELEEPKEPMTPDMEQVVTASRSSSPQRKGVRPGVERRQAELADEARRNSFQQTEGKGQAALLVSTLMKKEPLTPSRNVPIRMDMESVPQPDRSARRNAKVVTKEKPPGYSQKWNIVDSDSEIIGVEFAGTKEEEEELLRGEKSPIVERGPIVISESEPDESPDGESDDMD